MRTGYSRVPWGWPRRVLVVVVAVFLTPVFAVVATQPEAAFGLGVPSASFNVASARNGTALVLTAGTSNDANCVTVSGAHSGTQTVPPLPVKTTSWTFNFTAGLGDGTRTVTVTAYTSSTCTGTNKTTTASYVLDNTPPSITGAATPVPNVNGWNNSNVAVNFTCTDGGSGIASCSPTANLTTQGPNQSAGGTAIDNVGLSTSTTVSGINIDKTAPVLSGAPTTSPNGNGWYNADVGVHWTCSDALSGISGSCPADSTITGEGSALTSSASVTDRAGNTATASSNPAVKIDRTPPVTTASALPAWNNTNVTVALSPSDTLSGVAATNWSLDGGPTQSGTSVPVTTEGIHSLAFWSVDHAGNTETTRTVQVKIDKTPPTISHTQAPSANVNGWNNTSVTVTFTCGDALSGIANCTAPITVNGEGKDRPATGTSLDNAGNSATDPATVSIDKTAPTITSTRTPAANANGWNNTAVTVTFACGDALSGIDTCTHPTVLGEGANQSATGTAVDAAGNSASTTVSGINVDETPPTITGAPTTNPNANGWYKGNVTIHWTCGDTLAGVVACPADSVITGNGLGLTVSASVGDKAGNITIANSPPVNIDRSPPTTSSDAPTGWQTSDPTVHFFASDDFSGVAGTFFTLNAGATQSGSSVLISTEGTTTVEFWSVDQAGNAELHHVVQVMLDNSAPTIAHTLTPAPNAKNWNNTPVAVAFQCADSVSGVASCVGNTTMTNDGASQTVNGLATDNATNTATDTATVNIDQTKPTILGAPDRPANANGWYNANVAVSFLCADAGSGVASCTGPSTLGEGSNQSVTGSVTDNADNSASTAVTGINIDQTAPTISGAPTTAPNGNGWYHADVSVEWTCGDNLSGIAGTCPTNNTISGEGSNLSASATVSDKAGNSRDAIVDAIHIDRTAPSTDASAPSGWVNNGVTVTLSANDNLSGVDSTHYILDGGSTQTGNSIDITSEGVHTLKYWSVDRAGNEEVHKTASIMIDKTAPTITHTQSPEGNANGWNNTDVTVTFTCADQSLLSGIKSCTAPQPITSEGKDQPVLGAAVDNADNSATDTASVSIDKTTPTITGGPTTAPNGNGWYNADVKVGFTCGDALSGVASCTGPVTLGEGLHQSVTGTATDAADNSDTATVSGINVDETPPTITGAPTTNPNPNGWYNGDVTVHWTCSDNLSGIDGACPTETVIAAEGNNLSAATAIVDKAGNHSSATVSGIEIDRTPPLTTSDAPSDWQKTDVLVNLTANDGLSGVATTRYTLDGAPPVEGTTVAVNAEGVHTLKFWSIDVAGNAETAHVATIRIDKTNPTIGHTQLPHPNANGWNNTSVAVSFNCDDALSGIASCTGDTNLTVEGGGQTVQGTATDNAGNTAGDLATLNIDETKPTITSVRDRMANLNGWYNADVKVSFNCNDALSGVASCTPQQTVGEGAHQSVVGTVTDLAGNAATATESGINVDETAPTLTGAPTTNPNADGWYNSDVAVHWTCADGLSGIDGSCPADSTVTSEGSNLSAIANVADRAGNTSSATVNHINIDRTPPATSVSAPSGWVNNDVTVTLSPVDALSGVAATYSSLDNATPQSGTSVSITSEGEHTLSYWSVDKAGNEEPHSTITIRIDKTKPTITDSQSPDANTHGWNNTDVTVTFDCADALSGVQSCTPPQTVSTEGLAQPVSGTAIDNAGNSATDTAAVNIDKTKPTITGAPDRAANANGWYNANVQIGFICGDALSGIATCSDATTLGAGAHQSVTGTATDAADNSASATVSGINVDKTPPTINGAPTTSPNANGWYAGDVTIHWTCNDALSGIDGSCPPDTTISGEGGSLSASASVSDRAGNATTGTVGGIKIDRTPPTTTSNAPTSWQKSNVNVTFTPTDNLSGVAGTFFTVNGGPTQSGSTVLISMDGTYSIQFWSVDKAGNPEPARSTQVQLDKTPPSITGTPTTSPNGAGWYNHAVVVHFTCADQVNLSTLATCTADQPLTTSGAGQSVTGIATDVAGNSSTYTVSGINIDLVPPTIVINGVSDGTTYPLGAVPPASCMAVDALSGPGTCTGTVTGGASNGVGAFTYTATATDLAGNTSTRTIHYSVAYVFSGFLQPINDTAHQVGIQTSIFKAGSTVPVKFQIRRVDGSVVSAIAAPQWLTPIKGAPLSAAVDESAYGAVATSGSTYRSDAASQQYIYNWSTQGLPAGYYYRIGVRLDDGTTQTVNIGLR